jgi:hypothetical protein
VGRGERRLIPFRRLLTASLFPDVKDVCLLRAVREDVDLRAVAAIRTPARPARSIPGKVRRDLNDLLRHIGVAADAASGRGVDVARGRRACRDRRLRWVYAPARNTRAYDCERETHAAPQILTHAVLGHRTPVVGRRGCKPSSRRRRLMSDDGKRTA